MSESNFFWNTFLIVDRSVYRVCRDFRLVFIVITEHHMSNRASVNNMFIFHGYVCAVIGNFVISIILIAERGIKHNSCAYIIRLFACGIFRSIAYNNHTVFGRRAVRKFNILRDFNSFNRPYRSNAAVALYGFYIGARKPQKSVASSENVIL